MKHDEEEYSVGDRVSLILDSSCMGVIVAKLVVDDEVVYRIEAYSGTTIYCNYADLKPA